ncbi:MAG: nitroreductase family deazaflavin-dependent oxidoreductase [Gammaproteobacteria bacterium]|nr:nitroreductase family deazaflavin-dependent oxidoreductase [Gammaproteobacteria bacterium]
MKWVKIAAAAFGIYVVLVASLGFVIGYMQPEMDMGIVLSTTDAEGNASDRVLAGVRVDDHLYVSANHWSRAWYNRALSNPAVEVMVGDHRSPYTAVVVTGSELARIEERYQLEPLLRFLTGYAPRRFLRLDPVAIP